MKKTAGFDLASLEQVDTAIVPLTHPQTGEELEECSIEVYGPDSEHFKSATTRMRARITDFISRNRGAKTEQKQKMTERYERERNISCIKAINGLYFKGEPVTDPQDACDRFGWVYTQACAAIDDQGNFIKGSSAK